MTLFEVIRARRPSDARRVLYRLTPFGARPATRWEQIRYRIRKALGW